MAITIIRTPKPEPLPWEGDQYTILDALKEQTQGRAGTLMLLKKDGSQSYICLGTDTETGKTLLQNTEGGTVTARIGPREAELYKPLWRD
jgi:hypothetical protein